MNMSLNENKTFFKKTVLILIIFFSHIYSFHKYSVSALENCVFIIISNTKQHKGLTTQPGVRDWWGSPYGNSRCSWSFPRKRGLGCKRKVEKVWLYHEGSLLLLLWFWLWSMQISVSEDAVPCPRSPSPLPPSATRWCFLAPVAHRPLAFAHRSQASLDNTATEVFVTWRQILAEDSFVFLA